MEMIKLGHMEESHWEDALARRAGDSVIFLHLSSMSPPLLFVLEDLFYSSCSHTILTSPSIWPKMTILSLFSRWFSTSNQWRPVILPKKVPTPKKYSESDWSSLGQGSSWWKSSLSNLSCVTYECDLSPHCCGQRGIYYREERAHGLGIYQLLVILLTDRCCIADLSIPTERQ